MSAILLTCADDVVVSTIDGGVSSSAFHPPNSAGPVAEAVTWSGTTAVPCWNRWSVGKL